MQRPPAAAQAAPEISAYADGSGYGVNAAEFVSRLGANAKPRRISTGWLCRCPAHDDGKASLCVSDGHKGTVICCQAGCTADAVCEAAGVKTADLFNAKPPRTAKPQIVAQYDYCDEAGNLLLQAVRFEPKDFRQRRPDSTATDGWQWTTKDVRRVLYRLPEIIRDVKRCLPIVVCEGEKDVAALVQLGFSATCNLGGAGKWRDDYSETLRGASIYIIADKDEPGRKHAHAVAESLQGKAAFVAVLELPDFQGRKVKDADDYIAAGATSADFQTLFDAAKEWKPQAGQLATVADSTSDVRGELLATLTPETAETELDFVTLLTAKMPPIKTVGNAWHAYNAGAWRPIESAALKPQALAILPEKKRTVRAASTLLDHVEAAQQTDPNTFKGFYTFNQDGVLINAANGIVRVTPSGFELLPHSPKYNFTRQTAASFNPDATAPLFERVLGEALPDEQDRELFKLCLGNFLSPDCRHETALVCYGGAGTSKSTLAGPPADALGVDLVSRLSMSQVCDPRSYHLPALRFAAVNLGTELTTADIAESGNFKTIVSGEPIEARPIYGKPFVMQTACKLWFLANSLPHFKHGTEAELRRTRFLRFDYQPAQKDVTLKARLAGELDGVLLFMLDGLRQLLTLPEMPLGGIESRAVHERFRISNDPVGAFVKSCCVLEPNARVSKDTLREAFADFSNRHELPAVCGEWFFRVFFERFTSLREVMPRIAGERVRCVQGVQLRSTVTPEIE